MENQGKEKRISRSGISFVIFCVLTGFLLDVLSSFVGFGIKKTVPGGYLYLFEGSPFFLIFPAVWMLLFTALALFVYRLPSVPVWIQQSALFWIIAFSFLPAIRNTALIVGMVFG